MPGQSEERPVVGRRDGAQPVECGGEPMPFGRGPGARMQRKQHRQPSLLSSSRIARSRSGSSVFSGRWIVARMYSPGSAPTRPRSPGQRRRRAACRGLPRRSCYRSARSFRRGRPRQQGWPRRARSGAVQVGEDADHAPVDLLGIARSWERRPASTCTTGAPV